jgi:hypothetical protein
MHPLSLRAHHDGEKISLDEPRPLERGERRFVIVREPIREDEARAKWLATPQRGVARTYGDDDPAEAEQVGKPLAA